MISNEERKRMANLGLNKTYNEDVVSDSTLNNQANKQWTFFDYANSTNNDDSTLIKKDANKVTAVNFEGDVVNPYDNPTANKKQTNGDPTMTYDLQTDLDQRDAGSLFERLYQQGKHPLGYEGTGYDALGGEESANLLLGGEKNLDDMSFDEAFQHSRNQENIKPGDTFTWRGKEYKMTTAEEEKYVQGGNEYDRDSLLRRRAIYRPEASTYPSDYSDATRYWEETIKGKKFATDEELEADRFDPTIEDPIDPDIEQRRKRIESMRGKTY